MTSASPTPGVLSPRPQTHARTPLTALSAAAAVAFVLALPLYFAHPGLTAYFTTDDMMNLYGAWSKPWQELVLANLTWWSPSYRPMGALFYRAAFSVFGFEPLPFHIACFVLMFLNLGVLYKVGRCLSGSREIAVVAVFIAAYHREFEDLYYNTGTIYDLLCFFFYWLAFLLYARWRSDAGMRWSHLAVVAALYICALNSKEMAATLPLTILAYELIYYPPARGALPLLRWGIGNARAALLLGILTIPYALGKMSESSAFYHVGDYQVRLSPFRYIQTYAEYLDKMFYQERGTFGTVDTLLLFGAMGGIALLTRSRALLFTYTFILFSVLPVIFITPRGTMFVLYISYAGWTVYAATVAALPREKIRPARSRDQRRASPPRPFAIPVLPILAAGGLFWLHATNQRHVKVPDVIRPFREQMRAAVPALSANSRVLLLDDPFGTGEWTPLFVIRLSYGSRDIVVDRVKMMPAAPDAATVRSYDVVLTWSHGKLIRVT